MTSLWWPCSIPRNSFRGWQPRQERYSVGVNWSVVNCKIRGAEKQKDISDLDSSRSSSGAGGDSDTPEAGCTHVYTGRPVQHYGSFYLRMGAVAFGIGSMIYSGLEFGQYFELEQNTKCHNIMLALTPATRMAFIFIQMYFIFLNNEVSGHRG